MAAVGYTSGDPRKVNKAGDSLTGPLVNNSYHAVNMQGTVGYTNFPKGTATSNNAGLIIGSSYAGGDDNGSGTDSTGRINLYSYQRANVGSFGENIRNFAMRSDAKTMQAFYMPVDATKKGGYDPATRDPKSSGVSWKPVVWQGAHYEANDHASTHGHWELEIADSTGALQGRLEIPFIDQAVDGAKPLDQVTVGVDYTNIRTNLADLSVRAQNITSGPYTGGNTALRVGGNNTVNKDVLLSISSDMASSGRRWAMRANTDTETGSGSTGSNFQLLRFDDTGAVLGTAIGAERGTGNITIGVAPGGALGRMHISPPTNKHGVIVVPSASQGSNAAFAAQTTAITDRILDIRVAGDANARSVIYTDGKHEWGDGTAGRDTNLYRSGANVLATDDKFTAIGISSTTDGTVSAATFATSADGTTSVGTVTINPFSANKRALDIRISGDTTSRLRADMSLGTGAGTLTFGDGTTADVSLYRTSTTTLRTNGSLTIDLDLRTTRNAQFGSNTLSVGGGTGVIGITNATTAPTSNPTGGVILYVSNGRLKVRQPDGTDQFVALTAT